MNRLNNIIRCTFALLIAALCIYGGQRAMLTWGAPDCLVAWFFLLCIYAGVAFYALHDMKTYLIGGLVLLISSPRTGMGLAFWFFGLFFFTALSLLILPLRLVINLIPYLYRLLAGLLHLLWSFIRSIYRMICAIFRSFFGIFRSRTIIRKEEPDRAGFCNGQSILHLRGDYGEHTLYADGTIRWIGRDILCHLSSTGKYAAEKEFAILSRDSVWVIAPANNGRHIVLGNGRPISSACKLPSRAVISLQSMSSRQEFSPISVCAGNAHLESY